MAYLQPLLEVINTSVLSCHIRWTKKKKWQPLAVSEWKVKYISKIKVRSNCRNKLFPVVLISFHVYI